MPGTQSVFTFGAQEMSFRPKEYRFLLGLLIASPFAWAAVIAWVCHSCGK